MNRLASVPITPDTPPSITPALVEQLRQGLPSAFGVLYQQHAADLLRLSYRILGSRADAEDVLHDLFVGLPELLRRYEERGEFRAWLRAVTVRHSLMKLRRERRREHSVNTAAHSFESPHGADMRWDALDLQHAIDALPEALRTVFVLKQLEGYSHADIADLLAISSGASRVRFLRALRQLRQSLEPGL